MKKLIWIALMVLAVIMTISPQAYADRGGHHFRGGHGGHVGVGIMIDPGWGFGWGPGWGGWPYYPYYPAYNTPPVVIEKEPPVYVQPEETGYWYYCPNPEGYYPYVKACPKGWMKVVPSPPPGEEVN